MAEYFVILGASPLQWVFVGELLPPEYKVLAGVATGLMVMSGKYGSYIFKTISVLLFSVPDHQDVPVVGRDVGTSWNLLVVWWSGNDRQCFLLFFHARDKGKVVA